MVKKKFSLSCGVANRVADLRGLTVPTKFVVFFFSHSILAWFAISGMLRWLASLLNCN